MTRDRFVLMTVSYNSRANDRRRYLLGQRTKTPPPLSRRTELGGRKFPDDANKSRRCWRTIIRPDYFGSCTSIYIVRDRDFTGFLTRINLEIEQSNRLTSRRNNALGKNVYGE